MNCRISPFDHSPLVSDFVESVFNRLAPYNCDLFDRIGRGNWRWALRTALSNLYDATGGDVSLVTDETIRNAYAAVHPEDIPER